MLTFRSCPKLTTFFGLFCCNLSGKRIQISDNMSDLKSKIAALVRSDGSNHVWVPADFSTLGSRDAIDKTLQRMVSGGELRRIDRGLYDRPVIDPLTKLPVSPDYRAVVDAIARRDQLRLLVDGSTAANDLGLCDIKPTRVTIHTDARRRAVKLDNLIMIAHNVEIGENTVIAAQTGVSGSTKVGKNCIIGGQVGIVGHIHIADGTRINAQSGLSKSVTNPDTTLNGTPAFEYKSSLKSQAIFRNLPEMQHRLQKLEETVQELTALLSTQNLEYKK